MPITPISLRDMPMENLLVCVRAPQGWGKTTCAVTISEQYRPEGNVDLSDTIWLLFDRGGVNSLREPKFYPKYVFNFSNMNGHATLTAMKEARPQIEKLVREGGVKNIIGDTFTSLDNVLLPYHMQRLDQRQAYGANLKDHQEFHSFLKSLPCNILALFHEKYVEENKDETAKKRAAAEGTPQGGVSIDITGKAANLYRAHSDLILQLRRQKLPDGSYERWLVQDPNSDAKSRFRCLAPKEPAHFGQLFEKIRAACNP